MANSSKHLQHRILQFKYHRAKEYDLDGDRVDTDEFIYDSDVSVEDKVSMSRLGKSLEKQFVKREVIVKREVTRAKVVGQRGEERVGPEAGSMTSRTAPGMSAPKAPVLSDPLPSDSNVRVVPDTSVDGRKIEEMTEVPIFLDGSPVTASKYEAIFESTKVQ